MIKILTTFITLCLMTGSAYAQDRAAPQTQQQEQLSFAPLVKQVSPAVVNIYTKRTVTQRVSPFFSDPFFEQFFGGAFGGGGFGGIPRQRVENSLGSGAIIDKAGLVVTNAHVIRNADEITVGLPDGREFEAQKVVVDDPSDLAILRIDINDQNIPIIKLKPSESLEVGDLVLAIGNPFGVGQTVTSGIVSAQARSSLNINDFNFFIQTDAAINPGNSGGPLVAMDGSVVGINTAIYSRDGGSLGIGFAIPSEMVATVLAAAKAGQSGEHGITRPWLGITVQNITPDIADSLDFKRPYGVLVAGLHNASPAKKSGVKVGDVVLSINGKEIKEPAEMKFRMATIPLGEQAEFAILQKGSEKTVKVSAMAPPEDPPRNETKLSGVHPFNGVTVANINPAVAVELGIKDEEGVVVHNISKSTQAVRVFSPGDIIVSLNGDEIDSIERLQKALRKGSSRGWDIVISRDGYQRQIMMR